MEMRFLWRISDGAPRFARDESEYVKTSNAKFEQLRGYPQASAEGIRVCENEQREV